MILIGLVDLTDLIDLSDSFGLVDLIDLTDLSPGGLFAIRRYSCPLASRASEARFAIVSPGRPWV